MSKVARGIKKTFRKVAKVVKKAAPVALAVGALVFTGGAALGLGPGWVGASQAIAGKMGASGVLGGALQGAITQAGYGALAGGAIAGATGGDVRRGLMQGAAAGAITGGVSGGMGAARQASQAAQVSQPGVSGAADWSTGVPVEPGGASGAGQRAAQGGRGGLMSRVVGEGGWLERNQPLVGNMVAGVGQGLMSTASADAEMDLLEKRQQMTQDNYAGIDYGRRYRSAAAHQGGTPAPARFQRISYQYQYNPQTGHMERVPVDNA